VNTATCALLLAAALAPPAARALVDLNTATAEELQTLPGIGEARAEQIVEWRRRHGRLASVEDLRLLRVIPAATVERLRPLVTAGAAGAKPAAAPAPAPGRPAVPAPASGRPAAPPAASCPLDQESPEGKINLNLASSEELQQLAGISEANARVILAWREKKGFFRSVNDLAHVPGLPPGVFATVQYFVTTKVDPNTATAEELVRLGASREGADAIAKARRRRPLRSAEDMRLVTGLPVEEREALLPLLWFAPKKR